MIYEKGVRKTLPKTSCYNALPRADKAGGEVIRKTGVAVAELVTD
jgi:hypothetical protein